MNSKIDARSKICPIPVVMAKKEVDHGVENFIVIADNQIAVENLKRFGTSCGYQTTVNKIGLDFEVAFIKSADICESAPLPDNPSWAVFVGKQGVGDGDPELGLTLFQMFFYTLAQDSNIPKFILFMNEGVKGAVDNDQVIEHLTVLKEKGAEILVCGTCLNYYERSDKLQVGTISNMYDIVDAMRTVDKIIYL